MSKEIVRAAIHPGIGIARVGEAETDALGGLVVLAGSVSMTG